MRLRTRLRWVFLGVFVVIVAGIAAGTHERVGASTTAQGLKGWTAGKGWGWVWGKTDEVGSLNALTDSSRLAALRGVQSGQVFDLGMTYSRRSYKWPGHSPGEILTFRSPDAIDR